MKRVLQKKLSRYNTIAKGVNQSIKPLAKATLALGGGFLAAIPVSEGAIIYSGVQNIPVSNSSNVYIDIDGDGGNDFKIYGNAAFRAIYAVGNANDFVGAGSLANALTSGNTIDGGSPLVGKTYAYLTATGNVGSWAGLAANGTERFVGVRLNGNLYGWVRLKKNAGPSYVIVDWAYESTANTGITPSASLPVSLTSFRSEVGGDAIGLFWNTASEENNAGFEIQRSTDGKTFETIDFVEGHGTTQEAQEYAYDDKALRQNQEYYYRLKQIDYTGQFEYSDVITARLESTTSQVGHFYPNPSVNGVTQLEYTATTNTELMVTVYSTTGQVLAQEIRQINAGSNNLDFNFSNLTKGNYFVKLQAGEDTQYKKLVIQ